MTALGMTYDPIFLQIEVMPSAADPIPRCVGKWYRKELDEVDLKSSSRLA